VGDEAVVDEAATILNVVVAARVVRADLRLLVNALAKKMVPSNMFQTRNKQKEAVAIENAGAMVIGE